MEDFKVSIDKFDGPLDLMLHLIRENKLDLMDLDVSELTAQYIAYLNSMEILHLEIASEYMVELATLIEYKSRKMLPADPGALEGTDEDIKSNLVKRLLEYQQFKEVSRDLGAMFEGRQKLMTRPLSSEAEQWMKQTEEMPYQGNPYDLMKAMRRCLMRMQLTRPIETKYTAREISMEDRELQIRARLTELPDTFRFEALLEDCHDVPMFIATFLAVLDLARLHRLYFTVDEEDVIWFSKGEQDA